MSVNTLAHRIERLTQIGRELSSAADLDRVLQSILSAAADLTSSETASVLGLDEESNTLRFLAIKAPHPKNMLESISIPLDKSIAGLVFSQKKTAAVNDVSKSPFHYKKADEISGFHTRSLLVAPILFRNESLGVLQVVNKNDGSNYNGDDVTILETLASQTAIAVQNTRLQKLLEKTQNDANRLDKMKSDFVAITSHELRTPLGLIIGHSTFLRELIGDEFSDQVDSIIKSAMRLKEIIENMSSMDNFQSGMAVVRQRSISVRRLILDTIVSYRQDAEAKKVSIDLDLADSDLLIEGDAEKIGIAITNLIKNAVTFANEGGHVFIVSEQVPGYVKVSVIDDGIGIPLKDLPHIFDRFYQVESHLTRKHGGMGLGLSVAKMMVEMHGGRIWAESAEGKGSMFTMLLPLDSSQAQAAQRVFR